ncbi:hypothetical protein L917_00453 [Phytophthora nicotianae]|uniref:Chromo domain-containing protein n=1 Tax=Phytophthora nicotianae TaxID=4792 RepID=W2M0N9_PHYNI|nr:hypothetical protein L917_00453 [Phytophthora nicotianae]
MRNGKYKYLVEWTGVKANSCEPQDNLRLINILAPNGNRLLTHKRMS